MTITLLEGNDTNRVTAEAYTFTTALSANISDSVTTIPLVNTVELSATAANQTMTIDPGQTYEEVLGGWTGKSATQITGATRAATAYTHGAGAICQVAETGITNKAFVTNLVGNYLMIYIFSTPGCTLTYEVKPRVTATTPNPIWFTLDSVSTVVGAGGYEKAAIAINNSDSEMRITSTANCSILVRFDSQLV